MALYLICEAINHLSDNGEDSGHVGLQFTQYSKRLYTVQSVQITVKATKLLFIMFNRRVSYGYRYARYI
jgi:hypothetical protein